MTGPLPPLPYWMVHTLSAAEQADVAAYAKLAVREALERAAHNAELVQLRMKLKDQPHACIYAENVSAAIRAMIEEYTND